MGKTRRKSLAAPVSDCIAVRPEIPARTEDTVDESLVETFPCSDPPSWAGHRRIGMPDRVCNDEFAEDSAPADEEDSS